MISFDTAALWAFDVGVGLESPMSIDLRSFVISSTELNDSSPLSWLVGVKNGVVDGLFMEVLEEVPTSVGR